MKFSSNLVLVFVAVLAVSLFASPGVAAPMDKRDNCRCVPYYKCDANKLINGGSDHAAACSSLTDVCCPI